jgi:hypothetical protein
MKLTYPPHRRRSDPVDETGYVTLDLATLLSGLRPCESSRLVIDRSAAIRSGRLRGRLLVHLGDVLRAAARNREGGRRNVPL